MCGSVEKRTWNQPRAPFLTTVQWEPPPTSPPEPSSYRLMRDPGDPADGQQSFSLQFEPSATDLQTH